MNWHFSSYSYQAAVWLVDAGFELVTLCFPSSPHGLSLPLRKFNKAKFPGCNMFLLTFTESSACRALKASTHPATACFPLQEIQTYLLSHPQTAEQLLPPGHEKLKFMLTTCKIVYFCIWFYDFVYHVGFVTTNCISFYKPVYVKHIYLVPCKWKCFW